MGLTDWFRWPFRSRANPVGELISQPHQQRLGIGSEWTPQVYGNYMLTSVPVYAAIQIRATAVSRPQLKVYSQTVTDGEVERTWVGPDHPVQKLLDFVNPHWTRGDLWRATETYLGLWGSSYWAVERDAGGVPIELWPLRPDKMRVIPDTETYIKGYLYQGLSGATRAFAPDEIIRLRYFNPMEEYAGLSPINAVRQSLDMGFDALRGNRVAIANDSTPGLVFETTDTPTEDEVREFYARWDSRFKGVNKKMRPAILAAGMKATNIGFSPRDMEHITSLRWTVEDVARVYNVPKPLLHDLERATYENIETARKLFWESCIVPQLVFYQETLQEYLLPMFNDPSLVVEFDLSEIEALQENENDKAQRRRIHLQNGVITPNEARLEMGLPPSAEPTADELRIVQPLGGQSKEDGAFNEPETNRAIRARGVYDALRHEVEVEFVRAVRPRERRMQAVMQDLFGQQTAAILAVLETARSAHTAWRDTALIKELAIQTRQGEDEDGLPAVTGGLRLFRPGDWEPVFIEAGRPLLEDALGTAAQRVSNQFALGIAFDVKQPIVQSWLDDRVKFWAARVNKTTAELVVDMVRKANEDGLSIPQMRDKVLEIGEFNSTVRAETIARTEMVGAQNEGHLKSYEQAGIEWKEWQSVLEERTRSTHAAAHGQIRRINEDFQVGSASLRAPGQGSVAAEVINCLCNALPVFEKPKERSIQQRIAEARCTTCDKKIGENVLASETRWCGRCKEEVEIA